MTQPKDPKGFLVVLPGEIIEIPQDSDKSWLTYQQFSNLICNVTDMVIAEENWQPMIDAIWENRTVEDYETTSSTVKTDFMGKWHHNRSGKPISLDEMMESEEIADKVGYKTASAVHKRIAKIASAYEDFVTAEYGKYLK